MVAAADGTILERVPNPAPLADALKELRCKQRAQQRSRNSPDHTPKTPSRRYTHRNTEISELHARIARLRAAAWHDLTARLAKTHRRIVIEDLAAAQLLCQTGLPGAPRRRRQLADAAMGTLRRQLAYKCDWHDSELIVADRWFASTKLCHHCGHTHHGVGWARRWECPNCGTDHDRDDNAAINLARYGTHEQAPHSHGGAADTPTSGEAVSVERLRGTKTCSGQPQAAPAHAASDVRTGSQSPTGRTEPKGSEDAQRNLHPPTQATISERC